MTLRALTALALVSTVAGDGCALGLDGLYVVGGHDFQRTDHHEDDTGQTDRRRVVEPLTDELRARCTARARPVHRQFQAVKHYRYQNGWSRSVQAIPIFVDALFLLAYGLGVHQTCTPNEMGTVTLGSCDALYGLIPAAVDLVYAIARVATVKPPKLVGKESESELVPDATHETATPADCPPGLTLVLERGAEQVRSSIAADGQPAPDFAARARAFLAGGGGATLGIDLGTVADWEAAPAQTLAPPTP